MEMNMKLYRVMAGLTLFIQIRKLTFDMKG
jgi:hypothetical protein